MAQKKKAPPKPSRKPAPPRRKPKPPRPPAPKPAPEPKTKRPRGRPPFVPSPEVRKAVLIMLAGGIKRVAVRHFIGIEMGLGKPLNKKTFYHAFREEVNIGKELTDARVINALFKSAMGGNVKAQIFWLCTRRPDGWSVNMKHKHGTEPGKPVVITFDMGGNGDQSEARPAIENEEEGE